MSENKNIHKDKPDTFDFVKVNILDDRTKDGNNCIFSHRLVSRFFLFIETVYKKLWVNASKKLHILITFLIGNIF